MKCPVCQWFESPKNKMEFRPVCEAKTPRQAISMDLISPLPVGKRGSRYIACIVDHLSKWGEVKVLLNCEGKTILKFLSE